MALAGLSLKIPADQIIDALKEIGDVMPDTLKETGCGGLAATPEADAVKKMLKA
jgi:L-serine dehydratase